MNLIRNLIGLLITCMMLPICIEVFNYTSNISFDYNEINDELSLMQLRELLLITYDMNISSDELNFIYKNRDFRLSVVNNKLLLQPGSEIFLYDIDDLRFETKNGCLYVIYERNEKIYERLIASEKGFYLNDFSDCDVLTDECDSDEE